MVEDKETSPPEAKKKKKQHRKRTKALCLAIRKQMEFYFGDANLQKDRFVRQLMAEAPDGFISLDHFTKFNKIKELTTDISQLAKALSASTLLEVSADGQKVRRTTPVQERENVDDCTVYVECLPADVTHEWVQRVFSTCGNVVYVSLPRFRTTRDFKGFGFVEFSTPEEAQKACQALDNPPASLADKPPGRFPVGCKQMLALKRKLKSKEKTGKKDTKAAEQSPDGEQPKDLTPPKEEGRMEEEEEEEKEEEECKEMQEEPKGEEPSCLRKRKLKEVEDAEEGREPKKVRISEVVEVQEQPGKRRRRRQGSNSKEVPELRVLPKKEWLELRAEYLTLQKQSMHQMKAAMRAGSQQHLAEPEASMAEEVAESDRKKRKEIVFVANAVVRVTSDQPLERKALTKQIGFASNVAYVDVKDGQTLGYVRCHDAEGARKILDTQPAGLALSLLQGEEESAYWAKLTADRDEKYQRKTGKKKKKRGKAKALAKCEAANQHVLFEGD